MLYSFRVCGLAIHTDDTARIVQCTDDALSDLYTRHCWKTQIFSPCALCSNSFYIGYRRFENFIRSSIMDIRRAISATHWVRGPLHSKVPLAGVGQVGPQNFARFFAAERPLPSSPVTHRGPSEKFWPSGMAITLKSNRTCRSGSDISAGLFRHPFCEILHLIKLCKWLVGTQS